MATSNDVSRGVDREARRKLAAVLRSILDGERGVDSLHSDGYKAVKSLDKSVAQIHESLREEIFASLPSSPHENSSELSELDRHTMERTILFLSSELPYIDPDGGGGWHWSGVIVCGGIGIAVVGLIFEGLMHGRLAPATESILMTVVFTSLAIGLAPIGLAHVIGLAFAAVHIFRVRVLRQDLSAEYGRDDFWPFSSREQYEEARAALKQSL